MRVVFRADASVLIGTGHVMRCLNLADELARLGGQCHFICRDHRGHMEEIIVERGYSITLLPSAISLGVDAGSEMLRKYSEWLGVPWQHDAEQTIEALKGVVADWIVVDHYALDADWESEISKVVAQVLVIDDLVDRPHKCNVLLDQNALSPGVGERYRSLVGKDCRLLLSPHYALLGVEYRILARALPERDGQVARVLVFVGGSDPYRLTELYLQALNSPEFSSLQVDVVIGNNHPSSPLISELISTETRVRLHKNLPSLAALILRADLMLGAGGVTNWERMCLGLPAVVVTVAENQNDINRELAERSLIHLLGKAELVSISGIQTAVLAVMSDADKTSAQSRAMRRVVDGRGAQRVARVIMELETDAAA